jgi:hypothetical protein
MKSRTRTLICGMTLFAAMAISVQLSAQGQQEGLNSALSPQITTFSAPHAGKGLGQHPSVWRILRTNPLRLALWQSVRD